MKWLKNERLLKKQQTYLFEKKHSIPHIKTGKRLTQNANREYNQSCIFFRIIKLDFRNYII